MPHPRLIVGLMGSSVSGGSTSLSTTAALSSFLSCIHKYGVRDLDTARVYAGGASEELLGTIIKPTTHDNDESTQEQPQQQWKEWNFRLATKAPAFSPSSLASSKIIANCNASLKALELSQIDLYYLHGPDTQTPLEEQCDAMASLFSAGKFLRWGVSNISAATVKKMHAYCVQSGHEPPKVYQGVYNPVHRTIEEGLLPLLRELGMVYYCYSPLAGGLFAKDIDQILNPEKGSRYDAMAVFGGIYLSEGNVAGLRTLTEKCKGEGISVLEATIRWFVHHCALTEEDGVILGASSQVQIEKSLGFADGGPLSSGLVDAFEELWTPLKEKPPAFSF